MASPIIDLLKRTLSVGGSEVRLIPGRRTVVVTLQGESEVRGDVQTSDRVQALIDPVLTPEARRSLSSGYAEWEFPLEDKGPARARVQMKGSQLSAYFYLDNCDPGGARNVPRAAAAMPLPPSAALRSSSSSSALEVDLGRPPQKPTRSSKPPGRSPKPPKAKASRPPGARSRASVPAIASGPTAEIDRLLKQLVDSKGSDLHLSVS